MSQKKKKIWNNKHKRTKWTSNRNTNTRKKEKKTNKEKEEEVATTKKKIYKTNHTKIKQRKLNKYESHLLLLLCCFRFFFFFDIHKIETKITLIVLIWRKKKAEKGQHLSHFANSAKDKWIYLYDQMSNYIVQFYN